MKTYSPLLITLKSLSLALLVFSDFAEAKQPRSYHAIKQFKQMHPCPATGQSKGSCKGWVVDHIRPLACGGADHPANMQWMTKHDAKMKDKWERKGC